MQHRPFTESKQDGLVQTKWNDMEKKKSEWLSSKVGKLLLQYNHIL